MIVFTPSELRAAIQAATGTTTITLNPGAIFGSVVTLGKVASLAPPLAAIPGSGYTVDGTNTTILDTRIYQQNIDDNNQAGGIAYSPGAVIGSTGLPFTFLYNSGGAADGTALLRASLGSYVLDSLKFTGTHSGWSGNGNLYMSLTVSNQAAAISVPLTFANSTVEITGQGNFNPGTEVGPIGQNPGGGSAFLHSWNNNASVVLGGNTFDEAGYLSAFNFYNETSTFNTFTPGSTDPTPTTVNYYISGNNFVRTSNQITHGRGSRLTNVDALVEDNTWSDGAYLHLAGDVSQVYFSGTNTFNTIVNPSGLRGYGIRADSTPGLGAGSGQLATLPLSGSPFVLENATLDFYGKGLALKHFDPNPGYFTVLSADTATINIEIYDGNDVGTLTTFLEAAAGGQNSDTGAETIAPTSSSKTFWAHGDAGNDSILGSENGDYLGGGTGADTIIGDAGSDTIHGDLGADSIDGGDDNDFLLGGNGQDTINGGAGADSILGGMGQDLIFGGTGNDTIYGNEHADVIHGEANNDWISGGADNDSLLGANGNDTLFGDDGDDTLNGGDNNDSLLGGNGNDTIDGGLNADTILGGIGADTMTGGSGTTVDRFGFAAGDGGGSRSAVNDDGFGNITTITFGAPIDIITDFRHTAPATGNDVLDVPIASTAVQITAPTTSVAGSNGWIRGTWAGTTFTFGASGLDLLVLYSGSGAFNNSANNNANYVVLQNTPGIPDNGWFV